MSSRAPPKALNTPDGRSRSASSRQPDQQKWLPVQRHQYDLSIGKHDGCPRTDDQSAVSSQQHQCRSRDLDQTWLALKTNHVLLFQDGHQVQDNQHPSLKNWVELKGKSMKNSRGSDDQRCWNIQVLL